MTSSIHSQCRAKDAAQSCTSCFLRADQGYWRSTWPPQPWHSVFVLLANRRPAAMLACSAKAQCIPEASPAKPRIPRCLRAPHPIVFIPFNFPVLFCKQPCPHKNSQRSMRISSFTVYRSRGSPVTSPVIGTHRSYTRWSPQPLQCRAVPSWHAAASPFKRRLVSLACLALTFYPNQKKSVRGNLELWHAKEPHYARGKTILCRKPRLAR